VQTLVAPFGRPADEHEQQNSANGRPFGVIQQRAAVKQRVTEPLPSIAIVSTALPPGPSGQARALGNLIGSRLPDNFALLTEHWPFAHEPGSDQSSANYRKFRQLPVRLQNDGWLERLLPSFNSLAGVLRSVFDRAGEISAVVTEFKSAAIIACSGSPFDLPAGAIAAFRCRLPLIVYLFDDPIFQWPPGTMRAFARLWEPIWNRMAAQVIAPNEAMSNVFFKRRARLPVLVRNPVAPEAFLDSDLPWPQSAAHFRIVYTGSVYHAQADAFINLMEALEELKDWSLHIYTSQNEGQLAGFGIHGPNVFRHEHVDQTESHAHQRSADVLFLPLAFRSSIQEALRTSAPMKLGEYLASGRPILVHAPSDTFIAQHFREHGAGVIVDRPDYRLLASALRDIATDEALRQSLRANSVSLAQLYKVEFAREAFWGAVRAAIPQRSRSPHAWQGLS
jgi:glycosyltransferase involved in cell wall biosynthesis